MKKLVICLCIFLMAFALVSCNSEPTEEKDPNKRTTEDMVPEETHTDATATLSTIEKEATKATLKAAVKALEDNSTQLSSLIDSLSSWKIASDSSGLATPTGAIVITVSGSFTYTVGTTDPVTYTISDLTVTLDGNSETLSFKANGSSVTLSADLSTDSKSFSTVSSALTSEQQEALLSTINADSDFMACVLDNGASASATSVELSYNGIKATVKGTIAIAKTSDAGTYTLSAENLEVDVTLPGATAGNDLTLQSQEQA